MTSNTDIDYVKNFRATQAAKAVPAFINARGDNQYIWVYTRNGFVTGAYYGSVLGLGSAIYYRKLGRLPLYAFATGASYAAFHGLSAYFRNEIRTI